MNSKTAKLLEVTSIQAQAARAARLALEGHVSAQALADLQEAQRAAASAQRDLIWKALQ